MKLEEYGKKSGEIFDPKLALELSDSVTEAARLANIEIKQQETTKKGGKNDDDDNEEENTDMKLFGKKRKHSQMHNKGFGNKSFSKKRQRKF